MRGFSASNIKLSISIMHCSWNVDRVIMLNDIVRKLGNISLLSGFSISDDIDKKNIWWNCKQAWSQVPDNSTHHLVLQDDMMPCKNFIPTLYEIIRLNPDKIIHIFASNKAVMDALDQGKRWYTTPDGSWGGSVILPRKHFGWCQWADEHFNDFSPICDDTRMDYYAICNQELIWSVAPSLIEHIGYDKSLIGNAPMSWRLSRKYIGDEDPLDIDWSKGSNDPVEGDIAWGGIYDHLDINIKAKYRMVFRDKCGYVSKFVFRTKDTRYTNAKEGQNGK